jgi:hypothetical protein
MYNNHGDIQKNRLYIVVQGKIEADEIKAACSNILDEASHLKPGFGAISDISSFVPLTEEGRLILQNTMKALLDMGMKHVVRIVPPGAAVAGMQWQRTSRSVGYEALQTPSLGEADILLDKLEQA